MEYHYNDYIKLTREYLRNLVYYAEAVKNLTGEIEDIEKELGGVSIKSPGLGDAGGGTPELNTVEQAVDDRVRLADRYQRLVFERARLQQQIDKVQSAVGKLPDEEREAVRLFYFDRLGYRCMARALYDSERTCRRRVYSATNSIAFMLFGERSERNIAFIS